jgi:hypothetical protein
MTLFSLTARPADLCAADSDSSRLAGRRARRRMEPPRQCLPSASSSSPASGAARRGSSPRSRARRRRSCRARQARCSRPGPGKVTIRNRSRSAPGRAPTSLRVVSQMTPERSTGASTYGSRQRAASCGSNSPRRASAREPFTREAAALSSSPRTMAGLAWCSARTRESGTDGSAAAHRRVVPPNAASFRPPHG